MDLETECRYADSAVRVRVYSAARVSERQYERRPVDEVITSVAEMDEIAEAYADQIMNL